MFGKIADKVARAAGEPAAFLVACAIIVVWAFMGPFVGFSDTWQLVINTGTTIVTFLMVFLIQNTQNREGTALQAKLDELIRSSNAKNMFIGIEHLPQAEIDKFSQLCAEARSRADDHDEGGGARGGQRE